MIKSNHVLVFQKSITKGGVYIIHMALSRISSNKVTQLLAYNRSSCQQLSTKPNPETSHGSNNNSSKLEEFKSKVETGPDLGDFIAGVVPRDLHADYQVKQT